MLLEFEHQTKLIRECLLLPLHSGVSYLDTLCWYSFVCSLRLITEDLIGVQLLACYMLVFLLEAFNLCFSPKLQA